MEDIISRKGEQSRTLIIAEATQVFSLKGFHATSVDEIARNVGMTKGAIYSHFDSKEGLCYAVLEKAGKMIQDKVGPFVAGETHACDKLLAMIRGHRSYAEDRIFQGGCLILNMSVEMDDMNEGLKEDLADRIRSWRQWIIRIVEEGKKRMEVRDEVDSDELATLIISTIMGAMAQFKMFSDLIFYDQTYTFFQRYLDLEVRAHDMK
ncbi:MAG: TetR/AcrR family transcriptional regulator [Chloroflexota bacterium]|nr:TetR/AcrR family transcriptional regulator [Chloroflexota bacterium]